MQFKVEDIVRIAKQPPNQFTYVEGQVGFISEISSTYATVETFRLDGTASGLGSVPLDCLELDTSVEWTTARKKLQAARDKFYAEYMARSERWQAHVKETALRHQVSIETALSIYAALVGFE